MTKLGNYIKHMQKQCKVDCGSDTDIEQSKKMSTKQKKQADHPTNHSTPIGYTPCRCDCAVSKSDVCLRYEKGINGCCVHCNHSPVCHAEIRIKKALRCIRLNKISEAELLLKSSVKLLREFYLRENFKYK